ncbi:MAG: hypothetical protein J2P57_03980 [Acidimicrobiaceae bacterium]|nr:hypothetical protein [Acidimicrobiaceae bacterium]
MFTHITSKVTVALAVPAIFAALTIGNVASASPAQNLSFNTSSDGASASWSAGKGSPIDLTVGSNSTTTYAVIAFHHLPATEVGNLVQPAFTTDNYAAGSPRYYITLSDGNSLVGYPPNSGLNGSGFAWAINNGNTYSTWTAVQAAERTATVTGTYVIADGDQSPATTDVITCLSFNGTQYNGC